MGAITEAMARAARARGARIETRASVARVLIEDGRALGVELESGRRIPARVVVANVNPKLLYLRTIEPGQLAPEIRAHLQRSGCGSASFRMNVALSELPRASPFCQHFAPELPAGRDWDHARDEVVNLIIDTVTEYAPNFRRALVACSALTPMDLERRFGLTGGDIFHGALGLEQMWAARPVLGFGD